MKFLACLLYILSLFSVGERLLVDASDQPISVDGENAFNPPNFAAGDVRGPCPGLNALANHGYIPRNGVTSFSEVIVAINEVYGMGIDLATILATMGTVWVGNTISLNPGFSIGGPTPAANNILGNLLGLLGTPQGLDGSHNFIEADSSNTRNDLYVTGDAFNVDMALFQDWFNMSSDPVGDYNMDLMAKRANDRFLQSIAENPYFYYGPFTGLISRNAGYLFAGRLLANYSSNGPNGRLTKDIVKSFFGMHDKSDGTLSYQHGWERIPANWYRRPTDYGLLDFDVDILTWITSYPALASIGGNTGTVNSFAGLDLNNLTGGVYDVLTLLEGNNLICFVLQVLKVVSPNALGQVYTVITKPLNLILNALATPLLSLNCPALDSLTLQGKSWDDGVQAMFPGAKKSRGGL